ncbi:hypothetical protein L7F22_033768 [Adiantum nelumboides]|nr:hypothetical protein [Adiantum nelumboides]
MRHTIPLPMSNAGCFGGSSVFQVIIRPSPELHGLMLDNAYGAIPAGGSSPMYGNIGVQPGFHCATGSYGMPGANMGMAGFAQPNAQNLNMASRPGGNFGSRMPLLNAPTYDNLTPEGEPKDYKEGGQAVKFDTFHGTHDKLKALPFLQQFDAAFAGGNFTESSKIRKAATFLKNNGLQWWTTLLNQVSSFKMVPLAKKIEKYCCGLPKGIKKYCTKTSVMNMAQLMENAEVADDLIQGKPDEDGFKARRKEPQGKQFSAKGNVTSRLTIPPFKKKPFTGKNLRLRGKWALATWEAIVQLCPRAESRGAHVKGQPNGEGLLAVGQRDREGKVLAWERMLVDKGNKISDVSPLIDMKDGILNLKTELQEMEIRVGVLEHTLLKNQSNQSSAMTSTKSGLHEAI